MKDVMPLPQITFSGLSSIEEQRPAALVTSPAAWAKASISLKLPLLIQAEPTRRDGDFVEYLANNLPEPVQVVYAVGDGLVFDVAKAVASANDRPLVIIPTALSSDSSLRPTATLERGGKLVVEETGGASEVIIDTDLIRTSASHARTAGIVDLLSITCGLLDWTYGAQKNRVPEDITRTAWAIPIAAALGSQSVKSAASIGKADDDSLKLLLDLMGLNIQLNSQLGHQRASRGIEHLFAEIVEAAPTDSYAERVGPGILLATAFYNKDVTSVRSAMEAAGVRLGRLNLESIRTALKKLPEYARSSNAPYSVLYELNANSPELETVISRSTLVAKK